MLKLNQRNNAPAAFACPAGMNETVHRLLCARGVDSERAAQAFLHPSTDDFHDPFLLRDMDKAVSRIMKAKDRNETVCVYGDYDVDGVSSAAMLTTFLNAFGIKARAYIPSRHEEGYGLNNNALGEISKWAQLMVTVDCGITAVNEVAFAQSLELSVVVTDHHEPGQSLPDCPTVDPLLGDYPFRRLCGAGVAFKLMSALLGRPAMEFIDLAALATVADVVPLTGENRAIVFLGLQAINARPRPGITALIEAAGLKDGTITSENIAFQLAPRLNAGGRLGDAGRSLSLLTAETIDIAAPIARALNEENRLRREIEQKILDEAEAQLAHYDFAENQAIVLSGTDWNVGVIGIAASRLVEKYHFPTVLLSESNGVMTGSCRSIPGMDIHAALTAAQDLLIRFGGHVQAAGLTLESEKLAPFIARINKAIGAACDPDIYIPVREYDLSLPLESLTMKTVEALSLLQPTGQGNPAPVFLSEARIGSTKAIGRDEKHLKLWLERPGDKPLDAIWFGAGHRANSLSGTTRRLLYEPQINEFMDRRTVQCMMHAAADPEDLVWPSAPDWAQMLLHYLTWFLYNDILFKGDEWVLPQKPVAGDFIDDLAASPRGTLLIATALESAQAAALTLRTANLLHRIDLHFGQFPEDKRGFNALCVLPKGPFPAGYARVYCLDRAALFLLPPDITPLSAGKLPDHWAKRMPDMDGLRAVYVAARENFSRPHYVPTLDRLIETLAQPTMLPHEGVLAALLALDDMGLIRFQAQPPQLNLLPAKKINPEENRLFRRIQNIGNGRGNQDNI